MHPPPRPAEALAALARQTRSRSLLALEVLPLSLRPLVRAWVLGLLWTLGPQIIGIILRSLSAGRRTRRDHVESESDADEEGDRGRVLDELVRVVKGGCLSRFPLFCAVLVGGSTLVEGPSRRLLEAAGAKDAQRYARWTTAFLAAWASIRVLQTKRPRSSPSLSGHTLDLTLFAFTRAVDIGVGELWSRIRSRKTNSLVRWVPSLADPLIFGVSSAIIMWSFIYHPDRLPRAYNRWIASAASVDPRLLQVLRRCRDGKLIYGTDTGQAPLLEPMCDRYGHPRVWADPAVTIPLPCEIVHMGRGPSCEGHALVRLGRSFGFALATYLPLSLAALLIRRVLDSGSPKSRVTRQAIARAFGSATRSSAFLASCIALFYYGVCLARSRLGPMILGTSLAARQRIDEGLCVGSGCVLCGWSVLLETAGRRRDMALFVAPRALATLLPRRYPASKEWRETVVFAASAAVVVEYARRDPRRVRGVLGMVLGKLLA